MKIDFNELEEMTIPGMNEGTGTMTCRMYNDEVFGHRGYDESGGSVGMQNWGKK